MNNNRRVNAATLMPLEGRHVFRVRRSRNPLIYNFLDVNTLKSMFNSSGKAANPHTRANIMRGNLKVVKNPRGTANVNARNAKRWWNSLPRNATGAVRNASKMEQAMLNGANRMLTNIENIAARNRAPPRSNANTAQLRRLEREVNALRPSPANRLNGIPPLALARRYRSFENIANQLVNLALPNHNRNARNLKNRINTNESYVKFHELTGQFPPEVLFPNNRRGMTERERNIVRLYDRAKNTNDLRLFENIQHRIGTLPRPHFDVRAVNAIIRPKLRNLRRHAPKRRRVNLPNGNGFGS